MIYGLTGSRLTSNYSIEHFCAFSGEPELKYRIWVVTNVNSPLGEKDRLTFDETERLLCQFTRFRSGVDRSAHMESLFQSLLTKGREALGREEILALFKKYMGGAELSVEKADAILEYIRGADESFAESAPINVSKAEFARFLSTP